MMGYSNNMSHFEGEQYSVYETHYNTVGQGPRGRDSVTK